MSLKAAASPSSQMIDAVIVDGDKQKAKSAQIEVSKEGKSQSIDAKGDREPIDWQDETKEKVQSGAGEKVVETFEELSQKSSTLTTGKPQQNASNLTETIATKGSTNVDATNASTKPLLEKSTARPTSAGLERFTASNGANPKSVDTTGRIKGIDVKARQDHGGGTDNSTPESIPAETHDADPNEKQIDAVEKGVNERTSKEGKPPDHVKRILENGKSFASTLQDSAPKAVNIEVVEVPPHSMEKAVNETKKVDQIPLTTAKKSENVGTGGERHVASAENGVNNGKLDTEKGVNVLNIADRRPSDSSRNSNGQNSSGINIKHPYIGKSVRLTDGRHKGLTGEVLEIKKRGLLLIDHAELKGQPVPHQICEFIDTVEEAEFRSYYAELKKKLRSGPLGSAKDSVSGVVDSGPCQAARKSPEDTHNSKEVSHSQHVGSMATEAEGNRTSGSDAQHVAIDTNGSEVRAKAPEHLPGKEFAKTRPSADHTQHLAEKQNADRSPSDDAMSISLADSPQSRRSLTPTDDQSQRKKRKLSPTSSSRGQSPADLPASLDEDQAVDSAESVLVSQLDTNGCSPSFASEPSGLNYERGGPSHAPTLPPVLLDSQHCSVMPASLAHLPAHHKIDIFNRRTGKILSGDEAVCVRDLPRVLLDHAEYEPVVPPPVASADQAAPSHSTREGRSSAKVRVNANVNPQIRFQNSSFDGKAVLVAKGPYSGMVGTVDACIPGGYYLIKGLFTEAEDELELQMAVGADDVVLIPESSTSESQPPATSTPDAASDSKGGDFVKDFQGFLSTHFSTPIHMSKLRVEALQKEKEALGAQMAVAKQCLSKESNDTAAMDTYTVSVSDAVQRQEENRLAERMQEVQGKLTKAQNELKEQLQAVAAARIHVLQCFDEAVQDGK